MDMTEEHLEEVYTDIYGDDHTRPAYASWKYWMQTDRFFQEEELRKLDGASWR